MKSLDATGQMMHFWYTLNAYKLEILLKGQKKHSHHSPLVLVLVGLAKVATIVNQKTSLYIINL